MEKKYTIEEGLQALEKIKLLMTYDSKKTLTEQLNFSGPYYEPNNTKSFYDLKPAIPPQFESMVSQKAGSYWAKELFPNQTTFKPRLTAQEVYNLVAGRDKNNVSKKPILTIDKKFSPPNVKFTSPEQVKLQKKVSGIKEKVLARKTPNWGVSVPEGFSPFSYEDFITELYDRLNGAYSQRGENCNYNSYYKKYFATDQILVRKFPQPKNINSEENNRFCNQNFQALFNKYYDKKFPKGVTPEDKEEFKQLYNSALAELNAFKENHKVQQNREPFGYYFSESALNDADSKKYKELVSAVRGIESTYGYDPRNWFDKFWDEWGIWIQVGVGVVTLLSTFGASSPAFVGLIASTIGAETATVISALSTVERLSILADFYMNASVGTYQLAKGDTKEAMLSFFFAALPQVHKLYSKIGEIFGVPSVEVTKSLANKISQVSLKSKDDVNAFIATLSKDEAKYFRGAMKLNKNEYEKVFKLIEDDMKKRLTSSTASKIAKGTGKFVGIAALDFAAIMSAQQLYDVAVEQINKYCKNCVMTEEEKQKAKTYLAKLTPQELKNLKKVLQLIENQSIPPQKKVEMQKAVITAECEKELQDFQKGILNDKDLLKRLQAKVAAMSHSNKTINKTNQVFPDRF